MHWMMLMALGCGAKENAGPRMMGRNEVSDFMVGSWFVVGAESPTTLSLDTGGSFSLTAGSDGGGPFADMVDGGVWAGTWGADTGRLWFDGSVQRHEYALEMLDGKLNVSVDGVNVRKK